MLYTFDGNRDMVHGTRQVWVVGFACLLLGSAASAQAPAEGEAPATDRQALRYQALIEEAVSEFSAGHYLEARALFRAAHGVMPNARTLRGIGLTSFELRAYDDAYRHLSAALEATERPLTEAQQEEVRSFLERTTRFVALYTTAELPEGTRVLVAGVPATLLANGVLVLGLGQHEVEIRNEARVGRATLVVAGGESGPLPVGFPLPVADAPMPTTRPPDPPFVEAESTLRARTAARITLPAAGVTVLTGGLLLLRGKAFSDRVEGVSAASPRVWADVQDDYDAAQSRLTTGYVLLGVGVGVGIAGTVLALRGRSRAPSQESLARVELGLGYVGAEVSW